MENHLSQTPLNQLVALGHFLGQQKKCILSIDKKHDPTIFVHRQNTSLLLAEKVFQSN
jgi:hypothetical protein